MYAHISTRELKKTQINNKIWYHDIIDPNCLLESLIKFQSLTNLYFIGT